MRIPGHPFQLSVAAALLAAAFLPAPLLPAAQLYEAATAALPEAATASFRETAAGAASSVSSRKTVSLVRSLRERAHKVNGFTAKLSVRAGGMTQSGTLLFLAPDSVHIEMNASGLGQQTVLSDGRMLWTITPDARLATKIDLGTVQKSWHRPLPNQATAIRDVFETMKPGTVRFVKEEQIRGTKTSLFVGVPETGLDLHGDTALPDRMRAWVGDDGLLRRQVLLRGNEVRMDATFRITDKNPHIRPGLFTFEPPSDYQVQDLTESTLKSLRSLETGATSAGR